jgi:hypothetical protein
MALANQYQPVAAELTNLYGQYEATGIIENPAEMLRQRNRIREQLTSFALQRANQRQDIGLNLRGREGAMLALENRNPLGANVEQIVAQTQAEEVALRRQHLNDEANRVRRLGIRQLNLGERDYREGFQFQQLESKLLLPGLFNRLENESPQDVLKSFEQGRERLERETKPPTPEQASKELLEEIKTLPKNIAAELNALIQR